MRSRHGASHEAGSALAGVGPGTERVTGSTGGVLERTLGRAGGDVAGVGGGEAQSAGGGDVDALATGDDDILNFG